MVDRTIVFVPQMSINDEFAKVVEWHKERGARVSKGDVLATLETTKAIFDVEAEVGGMLFPLEKKDARVKIGNPLAVLSGNAHDTPEDVAAWVKGQYEQRTASTREGKKFTQKALLTAKKLGIDINQVVSKSGVVSEEDVKEFRKRRLTAKTVDLTGVNDIMDDPYPENRTQRILIIGGGRGAVQVLDAMSGSRAQRAVAIADDNTEYQGKTIGGIPVVGGTGADRIKQLFMERTFDALVISVSTSVEFRRKTFETFASANIPFANIVHSTAHVGMNVQMGTGNVILAFSQIGACAIVGNNNFLSAYINIEHHNVLGSHCSFGPGVCFSSRVSVGDAVRFGTGIFVEPGIAIGAGSIVGSGSIITNTVPANSIVKTQVQSVIRKRE